MGGDGLPPHGLLSRRGKMIRKIDDLIYQGDLGAARSGEFKSLDISTVLNLQRVTYPLDGDYSPRLKPGASTGSIPKHCSPNANSDFSTGEETCQGKKPPSVSPRLKSGVLDGKADKVQYLQVIVSPDYEQLKQGAIFCLNAMNEGKPVLIHCYTGQNRSCAFASMLLALWRKRNWRKVLEELHTKFLQDGHNWTPDVHWDRVVGESIERLKEELVGLLNGEEVKADKFATPKVIKKADVEVKEKEKKEGKKTDRSWGRY